MTQVDRNAVRNLSSRAESETPIRLVLVEDHAILRDGLRALLELESDVVIVGEFDGLESSLDGIRQSQPDVVVLDLALTNRSGIELLGEIGRLSPRSRKLVLTGSDGEEYIRAALFAGADGYVLKDASSAELMLAIRTVSIGQRMVNELRARLFDLFLPKAVHHFGVVGLSLGDLSFSETHLILIRAIVEYGNHIACLDDVTFLRFHLFQPAANSETKVYLTDIDIAMQNQFIVPSPDELLVEKPANAGQYQHGNDSDDNTSPHFLASVADRRSSSWSSNACLISFTSSSV